MPSMVRNIKLILQSRVNQILILIMLLLRILDRVKHTILVILGHYQNYQLLLPLLLLLKLMLLRMKMKMILQRVKNTMLRHYQNQQLLLLLKLILILLMLLNLTLNQPVLNITLLAEECLSTDVCIS
ncbi:hypothetical protein IHE45_15G011700 [Dioscorea alata]|uniref:Uncharacterized protein n=1 Tax=Dioscorea alata TaxID=55571 RepID=A0ACB7UJY6_DIOAL|nr:hypothetical protein IHE45_15G011700 [Dioscorea alata]